MFEDEESLMSLRELQGDITANVVDRRDCVLLNRRRAYNTDQRAIAWNNSVETQRAYESRPKREIDKP